MVKVKLLISLMLFLLNMGIENIYGQKRLYQRISNRAYKEKE